VTRVATPETTTAAGLSPGPDRLRVLMYSPHSHSGWHHYSVALCNALVKHPRVTHVHYLMALREQRLFAAEELDILDPAVHRSYLAPPEHLRRVRRAWLFLRNTAFWWRALWRRNYDVLHVQSVSFNILRDFSLLLLYCFRLTGIPIVRTIHELVMPFQEQQQTRLARSRSRLELRLSSELIVHDASLRDRLRQEFPTPQRIITIIPHGNCLMFRKYLPEGYDDAEVYRSNQPPLILFLGLKRHKGLAVFLDAWRMITAEGHVLKALLTGEIGDPDLIDEAKQLPAIEVHAGYIPNADLWRCFARVSFVVMPYLSGATSGAVHLAYAFKRPVVASDLDCFHEVVIPGKTGIIVPKADPLALKNTIIALGNDPRRCRAMGESGFRLESSSCYDWDTIANATVQVYVNACAREDSMHANSRSINTRHSHSRL